MDKSIIFYGAGANLRENIAKWCEEGLVPVCIADADPGKQHTTYDIPGRERGVEILPLSEAVGRYPDYELYLTQINNLAQIRKSLLDFGIREKRIRFCEPVEWRKGCRNQGGFIAYDVDIFSPCCSKQAPRIKRTGNFENDMDLYAAVLTQLIEDIKNGKPTVCDGCRTLREDCYPIVPALPNTINLSTGFGKDKCNFNCTYCGQKVFNTIKNEMTAYDIFADCVTNHRGLAILWNAGEITINPHCEKILDLWLDNNICGQICTNASIHNSKLASVLRYTDTTLNVSVDAGTRETFARVKGVDCFEKVVGNLDKYADFANTIELKYVCCHEMNFTNDDILGFLTLANRLSLKTRVYVIISHDFNSGGWGHISQLAEHEFRTARDFYSMGMISRLSECELGLICDFYKKGSEYGLNMSFVEDCFTFDDYQKLSNPAVTIQTDK
jgi:pyruvate-formate lyase-activating enzyme